MPDDPEAVGPKIEWVETRDGVYNVYANYANALWTPNDIRLKFGALAKIVDAIGDSPRILIVEEHVNVTLAWSEAKLLQKMLSDIISKFEDLNGEIKTPQIP